jgi:aminocarboxymuconate-semialdehyde decarboxylase
VAQTRTLSGGEIRRCPQAREEVSFPASTSGASKHRGEQENGGKMPISKRAFLISAAAATGGLVIGRSSAGAETRARVIDAHTHWYPPEWVDLVQKEGEAAGARLGRNDRGGITFSTAGIGAVFSPSYIDLDSRIKSMDETGIDAQVLSLMAPMVYWAPPALGLKLAQTYNDACSAAHRKYPARFLGLAMLPMQEPELALQELERAGKLPGLRGVMMATAVNGKNLDEKAFFPIYAKCEELDWPIFTHPVAPLGGERMSKHYLSNLLGNPVEIGIAGYSLILGGVLDAFPKLEVMLPRAGGNVPWGIMRLDRTVERMPQLAQAKRPATVYLKRFYYDCIIESPQIVTDLIRLVGADRVLFGTDYPSPMRDAHPTEFIQKLAELSGSDRDAILGGNAARAFKL